MTESKTTTALKIVFALSFFFVIWPVYGLFDRKGFQAAGVVCSALICATALLAFIYFSYMGRAWFWITFAAIIVFDAVATVASMKLNHKLSSAWVIPIALSVVIGFGALIEIVGRRFEGHSL